MQYFGNFFNALADLVNIIIEIYMFVVIGRAVISWVNADPYNPIVRFLVQITEPLLSRIRRIIPPLGGIDLSPMVLILALIFLQRFIVPSLHYFASNLR